MAVDDSFTKVLLHMDGADGSQTFTDESGKTWTANGGAQIDTAQSVFGGSSLRIGPTAGYIITADSTDFDFGTGDFTIDFRFRSSGALNTTRGIFTTADAASSGDYVIRTDSSGHIQLTRMNVADDLTTTGTLTTDTWYHIAIVRYGNTVKVYIGGTADATTFDATGVSYNCGLYPLIGRNLADTSANYMDGWIDEFRVSKGIARWTTNFTPPASAYAPPLILSSAQCIII